MAPAVADGGDAEFEEVRADGDRLGLEAVGHVVEGLKALRPRPNFGVEGRRNPLARDSQAVCNQRTEGLRLFFPETSLPRQSLLRRLASDAACLKVAVNQKSAWEKGTRT